VARRNPRARSRVLGKRARATSPIGKVRSSRVRDPDQLDPVATGLDNQLTPIRFKHTDDPIILPVEEDSVMQPPPSKQTSLRSPGDTW